MSEKKVKDHLHDMDSSWAEPSPQVSPGEGAGAVIDADDALKSVEEYAQLAPGWDSYDGKPMASRTIENAKLLIETLRGIPAKYFNPAPCGDGTIGFEIVWADGRELWIDVGPWAEMSAYIPNRSVTKHDNPNSPAPTAETPAASGTADREKRAILREEAARYAAQALSPSNREWYQRVVDALDSCARPQAGVSESEIAQIINPVVINKYRDELASGRKAANGKMWADVAYGKDREIVLAQARAILALTAEPAPKEECTFFPKCACVKWCAVNFRRRVPDRAAPAVGEWQPPAGYKLVPVEPTREMLNAGYVAQAARYVSSGVGLAYRAMIAAAPPPASLRKKR